MGVDAYLMGTLNPGHEPDQSEVERIFRDRDTVLEEAFSPYPVSYVGLVHLFREDGEPVELEVEQLANFEPGWPMGRYYSPSYPAGDLPYYLMVGLWLRAVIPEMDVWYGGDQEQGFDLLNDRLAGRLAGRYLRYGHREAEETVADPVEDWAPVAWELTRTGSACGRIHLGRSEFLEPPEGREPADALTPALTCRDPFVRWRGLWAALHDALDERYAAQLALGLSLGSAQPRDVSARRVVLVGGRLLDELPERLEGVLERLERTNLEGASEQVEAIRAAVGGKMQEEHLAPYRTGGQGMQRFGEELSEMLRSDGLL